MLRGPALGLSTALFLPDRPGGPNEAGGFSPKQIIRVSLASLGQQDFDHDAAAAFGVMVVDRRTQVGQLASRSVRGYAFRRAAGDFRLEVLDELRIPTKPARHSNRKPATD